MGEANEVLPGDAYVSVPRVQLDEWSHLLVQLAESRGLGQNTRDQAMETSGRIAYWAQQHGTAFFAAATLPSADTGQAREPALIYDDKGSFHGVQGGACEHRTVGSHRAWCHDCREWCYPSDPCVRCKFEPSPATVQAPDVAAVLDRLNVAELADDEEQEFNDGQRWMLQKIRRALLGTKAPRGKAS